VLTGSGSVVLAIAWVEQLPVEVRVSLKFLVSILEQRVRVLLFCISDELSKELV